MSDDTDGAELVDRTRINTMSTDADKIKAALKIATENAVDDGEHHKMYCIDQMVRALTGCPMVQKTALDYRQQPYTYETMGESAEYEAFVARYTDDVEREWDTGIAP